MDRRHRHFRSTGSTDIAHDRGMNEALIAIGTSHIFKVTFRVCDHAVLLIDLINIQINGQFQSFFYSFFTNRHKSYITAFSEVSGAFRAIDMEEPSSF